MYLFGHGTTFNIKNTESQYDDFSKNADCQSLKYSLEPEHTAPTEETEGQKVKSEYRSMTAQVEQRSSRSGEHEQLNI